MKPKWLAITTAMAVVALALFAFLPLPQWHRTTFVMEPLEIISVRAATEGFIANILAKEGDEVHRGMLLAVMRDRNLEEKRNSLQSQIAVLDRSILAQSMQGAVAESRVTMQRRTQLGRQLADAEVQLERLNITAIDDGVIVTPKIEQKVGVMLKQGDQFCEIAKAGSVQARVRVDDWHLENVVVGAPATLWLNAAEGRTLKGHVTRLAPASELHQRLSPSAVQNAASNDNPMNSGEVTTVKVLGEKAAAKKTRSARDEAEASADEATSPFDAPLTRFDAIIKVDPNPMIRPGMSGEAKVYGPSRPMAVILWRGMRDWFRSRIWW